MNDQPHLKLKELIAQSGIAVLNQPDNCETWLRQSCPQSTWEISLLMAAFRSGVPAALLSRNPSVPPQSLRSDMIQRVQTSTGLAPDAAAWGVDAWAFILAGNMNAAVQPAANYAQPAQQANIPPQNYARPDAEMGAQTAAQPFAQPQVAQPQAFAQPQLNLPNVPGRLCPYCGAPAPGQMCGNCRRDTTARRRVCAKCGRLTPSVEPACMACGVRPSSGLVWKIPLIIGIIIVALILIVVANS